MPRGISLHIGVNKLDTNHYTSGFGTLYGCHGDARQMANLAGRNNFEVDEDSILLDGDAIIGEGLFNPNTKFSQKIERAITELAAGDIFLFTFAGHGSEVDDPNGIEETGKNQTLCFYDRQMIDNELAKYWARFKPGVRILFISDSCHSGTVAEISRGNIFSRILEGLRKIISLEKRQLRALPENLGNQIIETHQNLYQPIFESLKDTNKSSQETLQGIQAYLISMTACQDKQKARDGIDNGVFTEVFKSVFYNGGRQKPYEDFFSIVKQQTTEKVNLLEPDNDNPQEPNLRFLGTEDNADFIKFKKQKPFTITPPTHS